VTLFEMSASYRSSAAAIHRFPIGPPSPSPDPVAPAGPGIFSRSFDIISVVSTAVNLPRRTRAHVNEKHTGRSETLARSGDR